MGKHDIMAKIAAVGIGGAGCNVISDFYYGLPEVDTIAIDTDSKSLDGILSDRKLQLRSITAGRESDVRREIAEILNGYDMVYIVAGLGGRTGNSISPLVADVAGSLGCITTTIAIAPSSEGNEGTTAIIRSFCPMTVVIENSLVPKSIPKDKVYEVVNRSIVDYVERHIAKTLTIFEKNLAKNVKEALKGEKQSVFLGFARAVRV